MVYSDKEIKAAVKKNHIVIHPYVEENINGSSVDVTLGEHFYVTDKIENQIGYNPYDPDDVKRYFKYKKAMTHGEWQSRHKGLHFKGIPDDLLIIVLKPHERILAHTAEFIGIKAPGTSEMRARSTTGRNGIVVCKDAGWGDPGYINRWTMEIQNDNEEWLPLIVGARIGQIVFHATGEVEKSYEQGGKYQSSGNIEELIKSWTPEQMVPQAYRDLDRILKTR